MSRHRTTKPGRSPAAESDCASAFQAIGLGCVASIKTHHGRACAGDVEALHQIRIAITRLRAAVSFFKSIVADPTWRRIRMEIAWLNGPLGDARDCDVMLEHARQKRYSGWAACVIGKRFERQAAGIRRRLVRALRSPRTRRLVTAMSHWLREGRWLKRLSDAETPESLEDYCERELGSWHKRLVRKGRRLERQDASTRHELRIKAKRLRYMLEALKETDALPSRRIWQLHRPARQLQRTLGDLRDLERFAGLAGGDGTVRKPPGYRRRTEMLLEAAVAARRDLKRLRSD